MKTIDEMLEEISWNQSCSGDVLLDDWIVKLYDVPPEMSYILKGMGME